MNTERIRHGGLALCFAAACGLLFLLAGDSDLADLFGLGGIVATLAGLVYVAQGLAGGGKRLDEPPGQD